MVQCFKIILCIFVFLGNLSAESIQISFENDIKLRFDNIRNYSDDDVTTNDSSLNDSTAMLELYPKLDFAFKEGASIKTSWVFELLKDPAANNDFQGEGLVLDELYFSFENEDAEFFIGKVNPNFAYLWNYNLNSGIWTSDIDSGKFSNLFEATSMPSALKDSKTMISLLGLCCVTHSASLHQNMVLSGNVGIVEISNPLSLITAKNERELLLANLVAKNK